MSKYIDADKLLNPNNIIVMQDETGIDEFPYTYTNAVKVETILNAPTADVEEVRHGKIKWVNRPISAQYATVTDKYGEKHYGKVCDRIENNPVGYCGECGKRLDDTFMNYCPNCGAKMDGERSANDNT